MDESFAPLDPLRLYFDLLLLILTALSDFCLISQTLWEGICGPEQEQSVRIQKCVLALLMTFFVVNTLRLQSQVIPFRRVRAWAKMAVRIRIMPQALQLFFNTKNQTRDACMATLAAYHVLSRPSVPGTRWSVAPAIASHVLSVVSLGKFVSQTHCGDLSWQFGEALVKRTRCGECKVVLLRLWAVCTVGSQLQLTVVTAIVGPPVWSILTAMLLVSPMLLAHTAELWTISGKTPWYKLVWYCFQQPLFLFAPCFSSVFGLAQDDGEINQGNRPGWYHVSMLTIRLGLICAWAAIMVASGWAEQYREASGGHIFYNVTSVRQVLEKGGDAWSNTYFSVYLLFGLPLSLVGFVSLAFCNEFFLCGREDTGLTSQMEEERKEAQREATDEIEDQAEGSDSDISDGSLEVEDQ